MFHTCVLHVLNVISPKLEGFVSFHSSSGGMHMAHNFSLQDSSLPRKQRAELAVKDSSPKRMELWVM